MTTIIIGAGASGLACAVRIKQNEPKNKVILIERLDVPGKKLLATGNGRCNLSNINAEHYKEVLNFFSSIGLVTRQDSEGRIYPYSLQSRCVVDILYQACIRTGVELITDCTVLSVNEALSVTTSRGIFTADAVVIAAGGKAQKNLGSNGSGYELLRSLGHTVTPLCPALVQLTSSSKYPRLLKGARIRCSLSVLLDGRKSGSESGEVLFTDYGISGIVTMNLSHIVSKNFMSEQPKKCHAALDLIPEMSEQQIVEYLSSFSFLDGILGSTVSDIIRKQAGGDIQKQAHFCKNWKLIITGTKGYDFAQITYGGANCRDFDGYESCRVKNLYACGEILDRQFPCGGFNLNHAFYSGIKTADQITERWNV